MGLQLHFLWYATAFCSPHPAVPELRTSHGAKPPPATLAGAHSWLGRAAQLNPAPAGVLRGKLAEMFGRKLAK